MNWTDLVWLGLGLGLGLGIRWLTGRLLLTQTVLPTDALPTDVLPVDRLPADRVESQQRLQSLQLAYQLATEMSQFKGGFLARISHELRSPLNGLIGMHQLILEDLCDTPEEEREFIAQANQSALKMIKVLDSVLEVARLEQGKLQMALQPLPLAALLQTIHDLTYLQAADRNLRLQMTLPEPDLYVLADPRRLRQVLLHLVDGSIAQMQEGNIHVSVHVSVETGYAHVWIDNEWLDGDRPPLLSEPMQLLEVPAPATAQIPSPGLNLLTSQILISLMQGTLTVVAAPADQVRLQCSVPLVVPQ